MATAAAAAAATLMDHAVANPAQCASCDTHGDGVQPLERLGDHHEYDAPCQSQNLSS